MYRTNSSADMTRPSISMGGDFIARSDDTPMLSALFAIVGSPDMTAGRMPVGPRSDVSGSSYRYQR